MKANKTPAEDTADRCESCGAPQPCARRACIEQLSAAADYYDEIARAKDPRP
jgi:hypothetical protein